MTERPANRKAVPSPQHMPLGTILARKEFRLLARSRGFSTV